MSKLDRAGAFEALRLCVTSLAHGEYVPTAAAVKSQLMRQLGSFDERSLGYHRFVEFLEAAAEANVIAMSRDLHNHPRVFPANAPPARIQAVVSHPATLDGKRLRREVWRAFVDWEPADYRRGWDRSVRRVFLAPLAGGGTAPWEASADRFAPIEPITPETQFEWMREFAAAQPAVVRDEIIATLAADAPLRSFKTTLVQLTLDEAWATTLREHVNQFVREWAGRHEVSSRFLFEPPRSSKSVSATTGVTGPAAPLPHDTAAVGAPEHAPMSDSARLRARLHTAVDGMGLAELAVLPVPARFLIEP